LDDIKKDIRINDFINIYKYYTVANNHILIDLIDFMISKNVKKNILLSLKNLVFNTNKQTLSTFLMHLSKNNSILELNKLCEYFNLTLTSNKINCKLLDICGNKNELITDGGSFSNNKGMLRTGKKISRRNKLKRNTSKHNKRNTNTSKNNKQKTNTSKHNKRNTNTSKNNKRKTNISRRNKG
jgi:hypothetical protein